MEIGKATVGVIAASCITVGAAGAFLISRTTAVPPAAQSAAAANGAAPTAGVEQSEDVVATPPSSPSDDAAPVPTTATRTAPPVKAAPARSTRLAPKAAPLAATAPREAHPIAPAPIAEPPKTAAVEPIAPPAAAPPPPIVEPPAPRFTDLVVSTDSVLGLQMETSVTSERARVEDEVIARVTRDVRVGDRVAIPAGSRAYGNVTMVDPGGKVKTPARLGIKFTSVVLADGTRVPLDTETIYRDGENPTGKSAAKIGGGAIGGAILGGIFGGAKGAVLGATAGGGAGTAAVMAGGREAATLPSGTPVTVRLTRPATVTVEEQ